MFCVYFRCRCCIVRGACFAVLGCLLVWRLLVSLLSGPVVMAVDLFCLLDFEMCVYVVVGLRFVFVI